MATALRGPNGQVYALAQGPLTLGGFGGGGAGNSVTVNHLTVGRVPAGGLVQQGTGATLNNTGTLALALRDPDFISATRLAKAVNTARNPRRTRDRSSSLRSFTWAKSSGVVSTPN